MTTDWLYIMCDKFSGINKNKFKHTHKYMKTGLVNIYTIYSKALCISSLKLTLGFFFYSLLLKFIWPITNPFWWLAFRIQICIVCNSSLGFCEFICCCCWKLITWFLCIFTMTVLHNIFFNISNWISVWFTIFLFYPKKRSGNDS